MLVQELIRACSQSNSSEAWEQFVVFFHRDISLSILRVAQRWGAAPREVVDDLVQDTYLKLCSDKCRVLCEFAAQHPEVITAYVKTIAMNVAQDHFKSRCSQKRGGRTEALSLGDLEPIALSASLGGQDAMEREILFRQVEKCLDACTQGPTQERDRLIFWLYYQQGMTSKAISELPAMALTAKGVESLILRLTRVVRDKINEMESFHEEVKLQPKQFEHERSYL